LIDVPSSELLPGSLHGVTAAEFGHDVCRLNVALGEEHEQVVHEVGRLAGELRRGVRGLNRGVVLAAMRTSVASSVTLRPVASTPPSRSFAV
jgi:hypothetical protein